MNMLEVIAEGADGAARHDGPAAAPQTPDDPSGRSPKLAALVARNGPLDHFVGLRPTAPCPFCGGDPPLAAEIAGRFIVGCESDDCHVNPQVSGRDLNEAWARWNRRPNPGAR